MKTSRCSLGPVGLSILVCQLGLNLRTDAQIPQRCTGHETYRPPENEDIRVTCGTESLDLSIYLCPIYHSLYSESLVALNKQFSKAECYGAADWTADTPALTFRIPITKSSLSFCKNTVKIIDMPGSGDFTDFSNIQYVNVSGTVTSVDPSAGMITYRPPILYRFSCLYPMQYILDNTELSVSGTNLAINDKNGSFTSTLSMHLYQDEQYQEKLIIPHTGLDMKTKIYVAVKATNLTNRFNVLLDRCYSTPNPNPTFNTYHDLFVGCRHEPQVEMEVNGESQKAHFSFEAFRFILHQNQDVSTFYLHCVTRLCEVSSCSTMKPDCSRNRQMMKEAQYEPNSITVTSPAIRVARLHPKTTAIPSYYQTEKEYKHKTHQAPLSIYDGGPASILSCCSTFVVAVIVCSGILTISFAI